MNKFEKIILTLALVFSLSGLFLVNHKPFQFGSVSTGSEYNATTTREAFTGVAMTTKTLTPVGQTTNGVLGSVVITGANTGIISFYDATSTGQHTDYASTTLATFPASTVAGTYTLDVAYHRGLLIEITGLAPTTTVTFK